MDESSTIEFYEGKVVNETSSNSQPGRQTLDLLKMYARSYSPKESLQRGIINICLN